ncbi:MAG: hypothetical protein ABFS35_22545 [Bacteroidota bacterium]
MKKLNTPLKYDIYLQSYVYEHEVSFEFGFYTKELSTDKAKEINGGYNNTLNLQSEGVAHWQTACYNNFVSLLIYKPRPH